jgi:membrane protease YdiL (CAAX protease family)
MSLEPISEGTPSARGSGGGPTNEHPLTRVFLGPDGLRVGWRLVIAISIWLVFLRLLSTAIIWIPGIRETLRGMATGPVVLTPTIVLLSEGILAAAALITAFVMSRIERRSFAGYGLPGRVAFGKRFWQGALFGFGMISVLMGLIAGLHGYSVSGVDLRGFTAVRYALLYLLGFIVVAVFEEFSFRGYLQSTLQLATGFWPAALVLAAAFGAIHLTNAGEGAYGAVMAGCFGLLAAFTLWRTGNIWFAIGLHAAWDWGETYFYSVRDSGAPANGHLLRSEFHGPTWLTGGSIGPEGSALVFAVLILAGLGVHVLLPRRTQSS